MTKAETDLAKAIVKDHYVPLTTKAKLEAAEALKRAGLVRIGDIDGVPHAKAFTRAKYDEMKSWE